MHYIFCWKQVYKIGTCNIIRTFNVMITSPNFYFGLYHDGIVFAFTLTLIKVTTKYIKLHKILT